MSVNRERQASYRPTEGLDHRFKRRLQSALLVAVCIGVLFVLAKFLQSTFGDAGDSMVTLPNGAKIDKSYLASPAGHGDPSLPLRGKQESDAAIDTQRTALIKWFEQTSVCMRRAADLEIRSLMLDGKDLADEANILEITDYTRMMCGGGLSRFLTRQAGYSIPDAEALLDGLAQRMVKARLRTAIRAETPRRASREP